MYIGKVILGLYDTTKTISLGIISFTKSIIKKDRKKLKLGKKKIMEN